MTEPALPGAAAPAFPVNFAGLFQVPPHPGLGVCARGLVKTFGTQNVLKGLNLDVPAGQFLAIVGRSGCGKSTLLRLIAGLETPSDGTLTFAQGQGTARDLVRIMYQEPRLLPWASVLDNVAVGLSHQTSLLTHAARAGEVLDRVGLGVRAAEWPNRLSGGQKQRVALARALVSQPRILALDEPLGALDALTRLEMQALLEQVWQQQRFTAILVTHDVSEAVALADRVVLIENGEIALDLEIDLPRPRQRGSVEFVALEQTLLRHVLKSDERAPDYII